MPGQIDVLQEALRATLGERMGALVSDREQLTLEVAARDLANTMKALRDGPTLAFSTLIDLLGMDYEGFGDAPREGPRYAVVYNLLSIGHNWRLRVKCFAPDDALPVVDSLIGVWPAANWFEREAFDLYGKVFDGHPDLRRILTDYGFIGHPMRKDFPTSGHVEMRYDAEKKRVIYQPVTIEPREIVPRVIREDNYGDSEDAPR